MASITATGKTSDLKIKAISENPFTDALNFSDFGLIFRVIFV